MMTSSKTFDPAAATGFAHPNDIDIIMKQSVKHTARDSLVSE
jgi:hypothetical protein